MAGSPMVTTFLVACSLQIACVPAAGHFKLHVLTVMKAPLLTCRFWCMSKVNGARSRPPVLAGGMLSSPSCMHCPHYM